MAHTKTFPVTLTLQEKAAVEAEAARQGRSRSDVIRTIIDHHYGLDPVEIIPGRTKAFQPEKGR